MTERAVADREARAEAVLVGEVELTQFVSPWRRRLILFYRSKAGMVALAVIILLYAFAFLGPFIYRVAPDATNPLSTLLPPSHAHPLGSDELGRDELARIMAGGQVSLTLGIIAVLIAITVGTAVGLTAGYFRGWTEMVLMRVVDAAMAIPAFFLVLIEVTVFGNAAPIIIAIIGFTFWSQIARIMHGETVALREREFLQASEALGVPKLAILRRHLLPHLFPSMVVMGSLAVAWAILTESALSFLGLGIQPPEASWGSLLQAAQTYIFLDPALAIIPGIFIGITVLAFNTLGDALRDVV
ncbi:MAG TPA: ABC transporter permease [Chloroflexota bacterium]|nr:ABC transporter permease [Chloroflexota bacterium]